MSHGFGKRNGFEALAHAALSIATTLALIGTGCGKSGDDDDSPAPTGSGGASAASGSGGSSASGSGGHSGTTSPSGSGGAHDGSGGGTSGGADPENDAGGSGNGGNPSGGGGGVSGGDAGVATGPFPAVTDLEGDGPFTATTIEATGPNENYTVYLPTELAPNGAKNPIVGWMSGGGTNPALYVLLPHLATHGFVVVASNTIPAIGDEMALGQEIIAGIDWALEQNKTQGSMLFDKLDETKIASMGYSMGSLATFTIADDPRLTTTVHISGGNMDPTRIDKLRAPAAFLCGAPGSGSCDDILSTECDIAGANCATDFMNATTPVFYGVFPYGHLGILTDPYTAQISGAATGWLRWKLMGDRTLESMFVGDQCSLCKDADWTVKQKNL